MTGSCPATLSLFEYGSILSQAYKSYFSKQRFCNVMLCVEGQIIHSHQEILSASSPWFDNIFQNLDKNLQPIIFLKDVKLVEMERLLRLLYHGEVSVGRDELDQLLKVGEALQIKGLTCTDKKSAEEKKQDQVYSMNQDKIGQINNFETQRRSSSPVTVGFQIAKKSAPESREGELQCLPSDSTENQISLYVSPTTSLDQKNTPLPSLSLHTFTATNVVEMKKAAESNTENVIDDVVNYTHSLTPTTSANMKASSSSQISFQIETGGKESTNVTSCHLPVNQILPCTVSQSIPSSSGNLPITCRSNHILSVTPSQHMQIFSTKAKTDISPTLAMGQSTSPSNIVAAFAEEKYSKPKKRKIYESNAPVYDNRQIYAGDLLQTQLDYAGEEGVDDCEDLHQLASDSMMDLALVSGTEDYGPFKKIWSETYLCYNLGKEIICLLCFCRFTQFKKYNLNRHMQKKHNQYYQLSYQTKRKCLAELARRYEEYVTSTILSGVPSQGNEKMAQDILQLTNIDWSELLGEEFSMFNILQKEDNMPNLQLC